MLMLIFKHNGTMSISIAPRETDRLCSKGSAFVGKGGC